MIPKGQSRHIGGVPCTVFRATGRGQGPEASNARFFKKVTFAPKKTLFPRKSRQETAPGFAQSEYRGSSQSEYRLKIN